MLYIFKKELIEFSYLKKKIKFLKYEITLFD